MKKLGEDLTLEEVQDMLKEADADGNGEIEFAGKIILDISRVSNGTIFIRTITSGSVGRIFAFLGLCF